MDEDNIPPSRPCRVRRPSSSMISSTTSPVFPAPPNILQHGRNRLNLNSTANNNQIHHRDIDDDIQPSSSSISSSTSSFTPPSPSPRPTRQNSSHNSNSSNVHAVAASSSSFINNNNNANQRGPVSPLDPDSTFWGPAPSPINACGPATPGGLCVVSSSTIDSMDDVPTMDDDSVNDGVSNSNNIVLSATVSIGSSSSSNNNSGRPTNNNNNGLILNNSLSLNHVNNGTMETASASVASTASSSSSSSTSSNLSHSNHDQSNDLSSFSLLPLRNKIKKASSFERFSLQAASNSMSSSAASSSSSSSSSAAAGSTMTNSNNIHHNNNHNSTNDSSVNQQQQQQQQQHEQHQDLSSSASSRLLWDSIIQSSSSSSASSTLRQIFTTNSTGMSGESKSLHIKIPSKKWAAKIANLYEQEQQMQALQQQNAISAMNMNLISDNNQGGGGGVVENLNSNNNLSNNNNASGSSNLMNDGAMVTAESLIRELSESPLNLTEGHNHDQSNNHNNSANNNNSQMRRNFMTTTTVTTTTAMTLPSKKILTPKQKMLHRVQSGEILQPQSMSTSSLSASASSSSSSSISVNNFQQQQNLASLVPTDNLEQQQQVVVHSPPPQLPPQLDAYAYEALPRDDFVVVQDSLASLNKVDSDPNNVSVLYDPDAYSYYYGNMLGDEIFSTTTSSTSSRGPLFMVPASSSTMALQDAVDSLQGQHGHVEFILGIDEGQQEHDHDNDGGRGHEDELDGAQAFLDQGEGHSSLKSQADSTLRNLLMNTHDDSWIAAGYQSRLLTGRSVGGGVGINNNNSNGSSSSNNNSNMNINTGNCNQLQNSPINAAGLNMNHLNNTWMNLNVNQWTHSMGMNLAQQDEQDEVMDMSVMESPDKHGKRGHIHESDVDLVGASALSMQLPMDLQQPLDLIGTQNSSKGQLLTIHDNSGGSMDSDGGNNNPINLQQHHRCSNDDEPVNLMAVNLVENDISQPYHHHHHHHHHYQTSSRQQQLQQQQQQLMQTDADDESDDHLPLLSNSILQKQSSSLSSSVIHSRHSIMDGQISCGGGYITIHGGSTQSSSNSTGNSSSGQLQQEINPNDPAVSDTVITINNNSSNNNNDNSDSSNLDNIDERRIIRVKRSQNKDLSLINIINSSSGSSSLALSPGGSLLDGTLTLSKSPISTATFILDKPVQPKSFASLPSPLTLIRVPGSGLAVFTSRYKTIAVNTRFGPVEGPLKKAEDLSNKNAVYPCLVMLDSANNLWQLDRVDDELCNWMKFVRLARSPTEQNAVISEDRGLLYFCTTKEIHPKTELQVGYSFEYAQKYGLEQRYADSDGDYGGVQGAEHETDCDLMDQQEQQEQDCEEAHINKQILDHDDVDEDDPTQRRDKVVSLSLQNGSDHHHADSSSKNRVGDDGVNSSYIVETYTCFECESDFPSNEQLNIHLDMEHPEPEVVDIRSVRNNRRPKKKIVKKLKSSASIPISSTTENSVAKTNNDNNNKDDNQSNNISHTTSSNNDSGEFGNNYVNNSVNNVDIVSHGEILVVSTGAKRTRYECSSCDVCVTSLVALKKHAEEHYVEENFFSMENGGTAARPLKIQNKKPNGEVVGSSSLETNSIKNQMKNLVDGSNNKQDHGLTAKVKCTMCYKSFKSKDRLQAHMIVHGSEARPLKCQFCPKRFLTNSALAGHCKTHAEEGKCFECPMCNFVTQQLLQLKEHVQTHKNKENGLFYCPRCSKKFTIYSMVRKHIRAFHGPRQFACDQLNCTMSFPTSDKLKLHKLKHSDHREFLCAECGKQFKRKDKLREHMKRMHENRKKVLDIQQLHGSLSSKNRNSKKFMPKVSPEEFEKFVYKCADCMMGFKRRGMLVNHLAKRHPEKPPQQVPELNLPILRPTRNYFCPYCDKTYKSSSKRKSHILKAHPGKAVPPQLKGKEILTMTLNDKLENSNASERIVHSSVVQGNGGTGNVAGKMKDSTALSALSSDKNNDPNDGSMPQYREVAVVGKVIADFHSCQWCHRQYATRAKLLQHQRKSHLHLMPADMQLPRTQKNNVLRNNTIESSRSSSNLPTAMASVTIDNGATEMIPSSSITVAFAPDSSTQIGNNNSISSSTVGGEGGTITLTEQQQHQLQQIHIAAEEGNVIGFLLTTTTVNGDAVPSEIVMVPVQQQQSSSQQQMLSAAAANAIQQALQGQQNSGTTTNILPLTSSNQNILSNVISSAVAGINIVSSPILSQSE